MRTILLLSLILLGACSSGAPKDDAMPTEPPPASDQVGDEVRGLAQNAKAGAVVLTEDGRVVYISGLDAWPAEALNQTVVAVGKLQKRAGIPAPSGDQDAIADIDGEAWELREASWEVR